MSDSSIPESWEKVHKHHEAKRVRKRRRVAFGFNPAPGSPPTAQPEGPEGQRPDDLVGLALSGGGIRSALFNDGFLQALSHRGLLRFVDYLSSVSGGGYIAGHLTASGVRYAKTEEAGKESFHDHDGCYKMGKDPATGELEPGRIAQAGEYLSRNKELAFQYLGAWTLNALLFLGLLGVFSTFVAILWRSLDRPLFREKVSLIGMDWGGDFSYAFLPSAVLAVAWFVSVFIQVLAAFVSKLWRTKQSPLERPAWNHLNYWLGVLFILSMTIGFAIFLGNGWTRIGQGSDLHLNYFAQWLGMAAAGLQVFAFFGRKQLFRSERPEVSNWQRTAQYVLAYGVVGCAAFSMLHWMGREDLSHYTVHRDSDLVRTDVQDWPAFLALCKERSGNLPDSVAEQSKSLERTTQEWVEAARRLRGASDWTRYQGWMPSFADPMSVPERADLHETAASDSPLGLRLYYLAEYALSTTVCEFLPFDDVASIAPAPAGFDRASGLRKEVWERQSLLLENFNRVGLASPLLARSLVGSVADLLADTRTEPTKPALPPGRFDLSAKAVVNTFFPVLGLVSPRSNEADYESHYELHADELEGWIKNRAASDGAWSAARIAQFRRDIDWLHETYDTPGTLGEVVESDGEHRRRLIRLNRNLLALVYPSVLYPADACRTQAVVGHDQAARKRWLVVWTVCVLIGFVGTFNLNKHTPLYLFYRDRLARNFLVGWDGEKDDDAAPSPPEMESQYTLLKDSDPTVVGLPYPLMLSAVLDSRQSPEPLLFTPKYLGVTQGKDQVLVESSDWRIPGSIGRVKLADAVAISGSALAPLMTKNAALRLLFSFFNLRLGQWVRLPTRHGVTSDPPPMIGFWTAWRVMRGKRSDKIDGQASQQPANKTEDSEASDWRFRFAADGGFVDYLGVFELLERRCRLIVVSDSGSNIGGDQLGTLARMLEEASTRLGVRFVDLDHEAPIDFERLVQDDERTVPQPFICMRVRYPDPGPDVPDEAYLIYVQMAITDSDPIEIRQIRKRFPVFPDEPTVNQFYADEQVAAYRQLGYHIGSRLCGELNRWEPPQIKQALRHDVIAQVNVDPLEASLHDPYYGPERDVEPRDRAGDEYSKYASGQKSPLFSTVLRRLLAGYRMACFEEVSYREGDIYAEAVWDRGEWCFLSFDQAAKAIEPLLTRQDAQPYSLAERVKRMRKVADAWLRVYEGNADVRTAYRRAVFFDLNSSVVSLFRREPFVNYEVFTQLCEAAAGDTNFEGRPWEAGLIMGRLDDREAELAAAHLCTIAFACHQLRRGTPRAVFQVGGRDKLIDLVISIVLGERATPMAREFDWPRWTNGACPEIIEMKRCVFQGAEAETTASFAYVMAMFASKLLDHERRECPPVGLYAELQRRVELDRIDTLHEVLQQIAKIIGSDDRDVQRIKEREHGTADILRSWGKKIDLDAHFGVTLLNPPGGPPPQGDSVDALHPSPNAGVHAPTATTTAPEKGVDDQDSASGDSDRPPKTPK